LHGKLPKNVLGTNTEACLERGVIYGFAGMIDSLATRFTAELGENTVFYCTGSLPRSILECCTTPLRRRESLVPDGLYLLWKRNQKG
ncbi:MAG: type III pantothenate kinase, partial [Faecalibacterium sp.]|nr:type III pantothenate kinase [Faecalibacterium sp.]